MSQLSSVVLTGIGALTPRGDFTRRNGWTNARDWSPSRDDFALSNYLATPKTYLDRASALSLATCALAIQDADAAPNADWGIVLGTRTGCADTMRDFWDRLAEKGAKFANSVLFSQSMLNAPASLCAIEWGLKGYHLTLCGPDAGLEAVRTAFDALRLGRAEAMLCGGIEAFAPSHALLEPREPGTSDTRAEAACVFVLQRGENIPGVAIDDSWFERALSQQDAARERWGDCGGANGALALLHAVEGLTQPL